MKKIIRRIRSAIRNFRTRRAYALLRRQNFVVMSKAQIHSAIVQCSLTERKLRKMGGGNLSKLRDPRKSMRRVIERFRKQLTLLDTERPS